MNLSYFITLKFIILLIGIESIYGIDQIKTNKKSIGIIGDQGQISSDLLKLLEITGVTHDGSLADIVKKTQEQWLRQPGKERWEIVAKDWKKREDEILKLIRSLDLVESISPLQKNYDYLLWMGAAYSRVESRLQHIIALWQDGLRFNDVVILTGARPLIKDEIDKIKQKYSVKNEVELTTEADCMKYVYENISMPEAMRAVPVTFVNVPMFKNQDGSLKRPTTGDTVNLWFQQAKPTPGNCLVISNQPYVCYQNSVVKTLLPQGFIIETVGEKAEGTKIDDHLDNLARFLYQEKQRLSL